jgi:hypothetical protein
MSFSANGSPLSIAPQETHNWTWTWTHQGWQGNTVIQPQPLQPYGVSLSCTIGSITANQDGSYTINFSVSSGSISAEAATYNIQISLN